MRPDPLETVDLVTFTEEILNGKLYFWCSVCKHSSKVNTCNTVSFRYLESQPEFKYENASPQNIEE